MEAAVIDLNSIDMFLEHNWLVKHNLEVNWKNGTIKFTRCLGSYTMKHQDIRSKTKRTQVTEQVTQNNGKIRKRSDKPNLKDLPDYI